MPIEVAVIAVIAIVVGCWTLVKLVAYGAEALGSGSDDAEANSLRQSEVEEMIRRAVREETRPLRDEIERLGRRVDEKVEPRRVEPPEEDPHDFGLIAEGEALEAEKQA